MVDNVTKLRMMARTHLLLCPNIAPTDPRGTFLVIGMAGEAGECANLFKKEWRDGTYAARRAAILKEIGDTVNYAVMLAAHMGEDAIELAVDGMEEFERRPGVMTRLENAVRRNEQ